MTSRGRLILNVNVLGLGQRPGAWRATTEAADGFLDPGYWVRTAQTAERGRLDAIFLADFSQLTDDPQRRVTTSLDPSTVWAYVAAHTEHLGLVMTATTTYNDPDELAQRVLSLHTVSGSRAGWNIVTTYGSDDAARNFGLQRNPDREERYRRAEAFVARVVELWDDAGGPAARPVIGQAGGSDAGRQLAAQFADFVFTAERTITTGRTHADAVKRLARERGRAASSLRVLPGLSFVVGSTDQEAARIYDDWERLGPADYGIRRVTAVLGDPVAELGLDERIPLSLLHQVPDNARLTSAGFRQSMIDFIEQTRPTLRELLRQDGGYGHRLLVATPERIADDLLTWHRAGAADGFNLMPGVFPQGFDRFVDEVVPLLQRRGAFPRDYTERTLRARFAAAGEVA